MELTEKQAKYIKYLRESCEKEEVYDKDDLDSMSDSELVEECIAGTFDLRNEDFSDSFVKFLEWAIATGYQHDTYDELLLGIQTYKALTS